MVKTKDEGYMWESTPTAQSDRERNELKRGSNQSVFKRPVRKVFYIAALRSIYFVRWGQMPETVCVA